MARMFLHVERTGSKDHHRVFKFFLNAIHYYVRNNIRYNDRNIVKHVNPRVNVELIMQ